MQIWLPFLNTVCAYVGGPKIFLEAGALPLKMEEQLTVETHPSVTCVIMPNLVVVGQTAGAYVWRTAGKCVPGGSLSRS